MMISDLSNLTLTDWRTKIATREVKAEDLVLLYRSQIEERDPEIRAFLELFNKAIEEAQEIDRRLERGEKPRPLEGVPFAIKDNILIEGEIVSAASKMLGSYRASYSATVINHLRRAGAIILGRTNMDEFAMGSSTENSAFGPTRNPLDLERVPGGSSGGTAAAVAGNLALAGLGSDTAGSVRQPASFCGLVGLKPTYGSVSRYGLIAMASSLDQIGPITKTVDDAEAIFSVIRGHDPFDATSVEYPQSIIKDPKSVKLGVPEGIIGEGTSDGVRNNFNNSLDNWRRAGAEIREVKLSRLDDALAAYYIISPAEVSSNLARFDGMRYGDRLSSDNLLSEYHRTRGALFGQEVKRRIILGTHVLSSGYYDAYYRRAVFLRSKLVDDFNQVFNQVDAVVMPTTPTTAFRLGEKISDPLSMYLADIFTVPANIAGLPAISVPNGKDDAGLPYGFQFIAPPFREDLLFYLGKKHDSLSAQLS